MRSARFPTIEENKLFVSLAKRDSAVWEMLKERELDPEKDHDPSMASIVTDIVRKSLGPDNNIALGVALLAVREAIRIELGLPV